MGSVAGYVLGNGQWWAIVIGLLGGYWYDKIRSGSGPRKRKKSLEWVYVSIVEGQPSAQYGTDLIISYCQALFVLLGRIAKLDGRVCEAEIDWVEAQMVRMNIRGEIREQCITLFRQGKTLENDVATVMSALYWKIYAHEALKQKFVETLVEAIYINNQFNRAGWLLTLEVAAKLSYPEAKLWQLRHAYEDKRANAAAQQTASKRTSSNYSSSTQSSNRASREAEEEYASAYQKYQEDDGVGRVHRGSGLSEQEALVILGISASQWHGQSKRGLKQVYRKLMSQHHPDKLIAAGASERQVEAAKSKTQRIRAAFDRLNSTF